MCVNENDMSASSGGYFGNYGGGGGGGEPSVENKQCDISYCFRKKAIVSENIGGETTASPAPQSVRH